VRSRGVFRFRKKENIPPTVARRREGLKGFKGRDVWRLSLLHLVELPKMLGPEHRAGQGLGRDLAKKAIPPNGFPGRVRRDGLRFRRGNSGILHLLLKRWIIGLW